MNEFFGDFVDMAQGFLSENPIAKGLAAAKVLAEGLEKVIERMSLRTEELGGRFGSIVQYDIGEMMMETATKAQQFP